MTNDTRTPDEIERDIVDERAQMSSTFNELQKKFSVDTIVNDIGDMVRDQGGELGRMVSQTVGRNPAAVAVVGVGLAWLFLGGDRSQSSNGAGRQSRQPNRNGYRSGMTRWENQSWTQGGYASQRDPSWYGDDHASPNSLSHGRDVARDGRNTGEVDASGGMIGRVRDAAGNLGHAISDAADGLGDTASDLTSRLSEGLEDLSDQARSRVLVARRAAHEARMSSEAMMKQGIRRASNVFEDQPLVVGALAMALGAAFGAMLPHSKFEDAAMGESRDRLFVEAEAVFREERDKAMAAAKTVGKTVASEVSSDVKDLDSTLGDLLPEGKSASGVVVDHAADAAKRVVVGATGKTGQRSPSRSET